MIFFFVINSNNYLLPGKIKKSHDVLTCAIKTPRLINLALKGFFVAYSQKINSCLSD